MPDTNAARTRRPTDSEVLTFDSYLRRRLQAHLKRLGFAKDKNGLLVPPKVSKKRFRSLHKFQREDRLRQENEFVNREWQSLRKYFANGTDVSPERVSPRLELVGPGTWQSNLFRLASLTWSVPVSQGYGRRMRFLVWDRHNGKLIGLIALGDPVFNLKVRDVEIGWTTKDRKKRLVNVLDAYVLGALPPYNQLLCGKLLAALIRTKEVRKFFKLRYGRARGVISGKCKHPSLVAVTTTSALGRSSVYNRVSLGGCQILKGLGYTSGWGHFHIPDDLFAFVRRFLSAHDDKYADNNRFGDGPNWRLRAVRKALSLAGMSPNLLRHGINRQVFVCYLATNAKSVLKGSAKRPNYRELPSVTQVGQLARERWIVPRALRKPDFRLWRAQSLRKRLCPYVNRTVRESVPGAWKRSYGTG
jgi:Domain of unknown function (DUF4338)